MATETAESKTKTVDQVKAMLAEGKSAKEIAEALGKTPATVYVHIRNLKGGKTGATGAKRGRPPKVQTDGDKAESTAGNKTQTRARPPVSGSTPAASSNGHDVDRFPKIKAAIEAELQDARSRVTTLEKMLALTP